MKKVKKKIVGFVLAAAMFVTAIPAIPAKAQAENLALNKTATTTDQYIDGNYGPEVFKASNAVDGNLETLWATAEGHSTYQDVLTIDLEGEYTFDTVVLRAPASHASRTSSVSIKTSMDGSKYTAWQSNVESNSGNSAELTIEGDAVRARYISFSFTGSATGLAYSEFEVYNKNADAVEHTITYAGGEGSNVGTTPPVQTAKVNEQVTLLDCTYTKAGSVFTVWSDGERFYRVGAAYTMPAHDVEFTAQWRLNNERENLALGGRGTSTDEWDASFAAQNAFDNNLNTMWATKDAADGLHDQALTLDLGKEMEFNEIQFQIRGIYVGRIKNVSIEAAGDDGVYASICENQTLEGESPKFVSDDMINARYLRFSFEGRDYNAIAISEVQVFRDETARPPQENLMTGATAESEHEYIADDGVTHKGVYIAQKAVDGDESTQWATRVQESEIIITLPEEKTFNQVIIKEVYKLRAKSYDVYVSDDKENWMLWDSRYRGDGVTSIVSDEVTARYLKIHVLGSGIDEGFNISEILLHNDPKAVPSEELKPAEPRPIDPNWIKPVPSEDPSVYQLRKADMKYGMFLCYSINTYFGEEWSTGRPLDQLTPESYAVPTTLDVDQWVKSAWEGGMNYVLLVTKHHEGFCIWDSEYTEFDLGSSGGEKIDVIDEVAKACKKYGMKLALYYSLWDTHWDQSHSYLNEEEKMHQYNDYMNNQITELLDGRYGEVCELWLDGGWAKQPKHWELEMLYNTVKTLQPNCLMSTNWTVTNESGGSTPPDQQKENDPIKFFPADFRLGDPLWTKPGDQDPKHFTYNGERYYLPFEATICMNNSWFAQNYNTPEAMKDAEYAKTAYEHFVNQGNTFVYNLAPRKDGRLANYEVERLYESARLLNIARGDAKLDKAGDCLVEIRHVTDEGHIANVTEQLWGNEGEAYTTSSPENMAAMGYELVETPENASGTFRADGKIVVEYVYHDNEKNGELEKPEENLYTVTVSGGKLPNGKTEGNYEYNTAVTVTADAPSADMKFVGWKAAGAENGKIISTAPAYKFYVSNEIALEAVYADEDAEITQNAEALLTNVITEKRDDDKYNVKFVGQLVVPEGYTIKEAGLVWSNKGEAYHDESKLDLANFGVDSGVKVTKISKISDTYQFSVTIKGVPSSVKCVPGRAYAKLVKAGAETETVQSAVEAGHTK